MTSHDVRDVLNLPADGMAPRPSKKQKVAAPRPNLKGLAREVQSLGGDNPIAIVPEVSLYKKRRLANRKPAAKWELRPFKNSARNDETFVLRHWRKKTDSTPTQADGDGPTESEAAEGAPTEHDELTEKKQPEIEDSAFVKFNVRVNVPEYNEEQYNAKLQSDDWTKDETDYLLGLVKDFDLRWPIIWDRYDYSPKRGEDVEMNGDGSSTAVVPAPKPRSTEDLKARYYEVAAKMMEVQKPRQYMTQAEWDLHTMMLSFDPEQERQRKKFALYHMSRPKEEVKEEESLLIEVKRIMARAERFNEERRELYQRLDYPPTTEDTSHLKGSAGLTSLLEKLQTQSIQRKRKPLTGPEGISPAGVGPNGQPSSAISETTASRRDSIAAQTAGGHRDSIGAEKAMPIGNKKGQPPPERRKLSDREEEIYGVSTHERLSSGPTFRYERVNKLFSHKSGQQQARIQNVLNELGIPVRLHIPTAKVVAEYEKLVLAVTNLVDARKLKDKVESEIKIEEVKKAERAKARAVLGLDGTADEPSAAEKQNGDTSTNAGAAAKSKDKTSGTNGDSADADKGPDAANADDAPAADGEKQVQKDKGEATGTNNNGDAPAATEGEADDKATPLVKQEEGTRPGSSGGPRSKRSASVLSATSDKSAKRQRK